MSPRIVQHLRLLLAFVLLLGSVSHAHGKRRDSKAIKRAQKHYVAGKNAYNVGEFDTAITEWKAGYKLHDSGFFLLNIAQAYRGKRDYAQAIFFLNAYLREEPAAKNAKAVKKLRYEMDRLQKEEENNKRIKPNEPISPDPADRPADGTDQDGAGPSASPPGAVPATGDDRRSSGSLRTVGLVTGGTGLALLATSLGFALAASSAESKYEQASRDLEPWNQRLQDLEASGERHAQVSRVSAIAGGAALVGGVVMYFLGGEKTQPSGSVNVTVLPTVGPRQAGATLRVQF